MQTLEWENMLATLDEEEPERAHFTCEECGFPIEEHHRPAMLLKREWRADNPKAMRFHRSFYAWSAYSPLKSWGLIARDWLKARGDSAAERVFLNDTVGRAQETSGEAPGWEKLRDRAATSPYKRGVVPTGGLVLTMGVDCQQDRVEAQTVAWGRDFRRWVVDYRVLPGHISEKGCRAALDALLEQTWPNQAGNRVPLDRTAIDGNAWTEDVWDWAKKHPISKLIMVRGRGDESAPRLARVKRERNERTGKLLKYARRFFNFGASVMKLALYRDLAKEDPLDRGYVGLPVGLDDEYFRQLTAERREPVKRQGFTVYRWVKDAAQPNEGLDTMLQAEAAATNYGVRSMPDAIWDNLETEREKQQPPAQGDLEDLLTANTPRPAATPRAPVVVETPPANAVRPKKIVIDL
jgi:phage terminase large subunit GpA-like protein